MTDVPTDPQQQPDQGSAVQGSDVARRARDAEALPLADRADAFAGLHDELRTRLESGGTTSA